MAKKPTFEERVDGFIADMEGLSKKYNLDMSPVVNFPNRRGTPFLSSIAIQILNLQGGQTGMRFEERKK